MNILYFILCFILFITIVHGVTYIYNTDPISLIFPQFNSKKESQQYSYTSKSSNTYVDKDQSSHVNLEDHIKELRQSIVELDTE